MYSHLNAAVAFEQTHDHHHRAALSRRSRAAREADREQTEERERRQARARRNDRVALPRPAGESQPARA